MPQWNCDNLHYVWATAISHSCSLCSNRLQSALLFDLLLPAVLGIAAFHCIICVATVYNSSSSGAWERWPQGLAVGSKIVRSQGKRLKGLSGWKTKWLGWLWAGWRPVRTYHLRMMVVWLLAPQGLVDEGNTWVIASQSFTLVTMFKIALNLRAQPICPHMMTNQHIKQIHTASAEWLHCKMSARSH